MFPSALDWPCHTEDTKANVTVLDLKDVYEKGQMRRNASSEQRLLNAEVHLKATTQKPIQVNKSSSQRGTCESVQFETLSTWSLTSMERRKFEKAKQKKKMY